MNSVQCVHRQPLHPSAVRDMFRGTIEAHDTALGHGAALVLRKRIPSGLTSRRSLGRLTTHKTQFPVAGLDHVQVDVQIGDAHAFHPTDGVDRGCVSGVVDGLVEHVEHECDDWDDDQTEPEQPRTEQCIGLKQKR